MESLAADIMLVVMFSFALIGAVILGKKNFPSNNSISKTQGHMPGKKKQ